MEILEKYRKFTDEIKSINRYIFSDETNSFIEYFKNEISNYSDILPKGRKLFRAQNGCIRYNIEIKDDSDEIIEILENEGKEVYPPTRMYPRNRIACEGRVNPKGISYIYLADSMRTAMLECRPENGSDMTVSKFELPKEMRIVNFKQTNERIPNRFSIKDGISKLTSEEKIQNMWFDIKASFSIPVSNKPDNADYTTTQLLAEIIKHQGFDGLCFDSQFGETNFVFFTLYDLVLKDSTLYSITEVDITYEEGPSKSYRYASQEE